MIAATGMEHIDASLADVVLGCVLVLVVAVIVKALSLLPRTQWWEITRLRAAAALRAWRGQERTCALCDDSLDTCPRCTVLLRDALTPEPYDQEKEQRR